MKVAVTSKGVLLTVRSIPCSAVAPYIVVVDTETMEFEAVDNSVNVNAFKGAGIQAATTVCEKGVEVLMTGYCGPKAFSTLQAGGVKVVSDMTGTIRYAVASFKAGKVTYTTAANKDAH
jgi:predicted Fe-Mo cluster-binding NifX family protein